MTTPMVYALVFVEAVVASLIGWWTHRRSRVCANCAELAAEKRAARVLLGSPEFRITRKWGYGQPRELLVRIEQLGGRTLTMRESYGGARHQWRDAHTGAHVAEEDATAHDAAYIAWLRARHFLPRWRRPR